MIRISNLSDGIYDHVINKMSGEQLSDVFRKEYLKMCKDSENKVNRIRDEIINREDYLLLIIFLKHSH